MAILSINGTALPEPSSLSVPLSDLDSDSTKRTEQGILQRDRIRQGIRKISVKWTALPPADAGAILHAVMPASFTVSFPDPQNGGTDSMTAYVGDRTCDYVNTSLGPRWNLSFDLIEY